MGLVAGAEAYVAAAGGALVAAGTGTTTTLLVTAGAGEASVVVLGLWANVAPVFPEFEETTELVSAATASGVQELGPDTQPVSLFAMSEA